MNNSDIPLPIVILKYRDLLFLKQPIMTRYYLDIYYTAISNIVIISITFLLYFTCNSYLLPIKKSLFCHLNPLPYKVLNYFVNLTFVKNFSNMYIKNVCTRRLLNLLCKSVLELFERSRKKFIDEGL